MQEEIIVENGIKSILQKIFDYYYSYKRTCKTVALGELTLPKYNSNELNYGDLNNFKSLTIRPINRWTNPDFPKTNWPDGMTDGTFIVETFNGIVRQTAISKMLCIRFFFDQTNMWTEWKEY